MSTIRMTDASAMNHPSRRQQGFTLIEILIAISLLSLIAAFAIFSYNGSKAKGELLFTAATRLADAANRFQLDTGCVPLQIKLLFDQDTIAGSTANSCGTDVSSSWDGPYMKHVNYDANNHTLLQQIGPLAYAVIQPAAVPTPGGGPNQYAVAAYDVPTAVVTEAMRVCNDGAAVASSGATTARCDSGTPANGVNSFEYVFSTNN